MILISYYSLLHNQNHFCEDVKWAVDIFHSSQVWIHELYWGYWAHDPFIMSGKATVQIPDIKATSIIHFFLR